MFQRRGLDLVDIADPLLGQFFRQTGLLQFLILVAIAAFQNLDITLHRGQASFLGVQPVQVPGQLLNDLFVGFDLRLLRDLVGSLGRQLFPQGQQQRIDAFGDFQRVITLRLKNFSRLLQFASHGDHARMVVAIASRQIRLFNFQLVQAIPHPIGRLIVVGHRLLLDRRIGPGNLPLDRTDFCLGSLGIGLGSQPRTLCGGQLVLKCFLRTLNRDDAAFGFRILQLASGRRQIGQQLVDLFIEKRLAALGAIHLRVGRQIRFDPGVIDQVRGFGRLRLVRHLDDAGRLGVIHRHRLSHLSDRPFAVGHRIDAGQHPADRRSHSADERLRFVGVLCNVIAVSRFRRCRSHGPIQDGLFAQRVDDFFHQLPAFHHRECRLNLALACAVNLRRLAGGRHRGIQRDVLATDLEQQLGLRMVLSRCEQDHADGHQQTERQDGEKKKRSAAKERQGFGQHGQRANCFSVCIRSTTS